MMPVQWDPVARMWVCGKWRGNLHHMQNPMSLAHTFGWRCLGKWTISHFRANVTRTPSLYSLYLYSLNNCSLGHWKTLDQCEFGAGFMPHHRKRNPSKGICLAMPLNPPPILESLFVVCAFWWLVTGHTDVCSMVSKMDLMTPNVLAMCCSQFAVGKASWYQTSE